ncbi:Uncharacterised protein [Citrobacter koseri]|nr:Uncharacterised protein [Citrobacter koseri]
MKPEHIYQLTGRDVLRWRRKHFSSNTGFTTFIGVTLTITLILLISRVA